METAEYARMEQVERTYWWHVGRLEIIRREIARQLRPAPMDRPVTILNVGCGTGGTIQMLEGFGQVDNVDVSDEAIEFSRRAGFARVHKVDGHGLPFSDDQFDLVGAFDVLEHIRDDHAALLEWARVTKPGGRIVLTVPAYPWLWSDHDEVMHHHRRYMRRALVDEALRAGLQISKASYAIVFSLPLVVGFRMLGRLRKDSGVAQDSHVMVPESINRLFTALLVLEARLHRFVRFPAGTSVLLVLIKPGR